LIKPGDQLPLVEGHFDPTHAVEAPGRRNLVIVAGLAELAAAGHDQDRLVVFEGRDDRAHPGVRDQQVGGPDLREKVPRRKEASPRHVPGA
jgi:hypothetical protein